MTFVSAAQQANMPQCTDYAIYVYNVFIVHKSLWYIYINKKN